MITFVLILTLINTFSIIYFAYKISKYELKLEIVKSEKNKILLGYRLMLWEQLDFCKSGKQIFYLPIRNFKKISKLEEHESLKEEKTNLHQILRAKLSWQFTQKDVLEFQDEFSYLSPEYVSIIVEEKLEKLRNENQKPDDINFISLTETGCTVIG